MKKTYKLLGVFWDKEKVLAKVPRWKDSVRNVWDYRFGYDLLDGGKYVRSVRLSEILSAETDAFRKRLLRGLENCDEVVVMDNAKPFGKNPVLQNFYRMRKGQILGWLRKMLPGKKIFYFSERISTKSV